MRWQVNNIQDVLNVRPTLSMVIVIIQTTPWVRLYAKQMDARKVWPNGPRPRGSHMMKGPDGCMEEAIFDIHIAPF